MQSHWFFQFQNSDYGFDPKSARIKDLGEHSIRTFVREFVQNSLDVPHKKDQPVELHFLIKEMSKGDIDVLKENLGQQFLDMFKKSYEKAQLDEKGKIQVGYEILFSGHTGYSLTVSEKNCVGLIGAEQVKTDNESSNFDALLRKVNTNIKENSNSGGTWGKGSSIYTFSSFIRTWFAYTVLSADWNGQHKRFIGRTQLTPFTDYSENEIKSYHGDGSFCRKEDNASKVGLPVINEHADKLAERFRLTTRGYAEFGTSFYIPAFNPNLEKAGIKNICHEFERQILMNWFVPLYNNQLVVKISNGKDTILVNRESLYKTDQLKYKLEILDWYYKSMPFDPRFFLEPIKIKIPALKPVFLQAKKASFASVAQDATFDLVIRKLDDFEQFDDQWDTQNQVALVRGEKGMLISHYDPDLTFLRDQKIKTECILFSGLSTRGNDVESKKHLDLFLAYAENPDHSEWCSDEHKVNSASYLERFEDISKGKGKRTKPSKIISDLLRNDLMNSFKKFFQQNQETHSANSINKIFQQLAALKRSGDNQPKETILSVRQNPRYEYPVVDKKGTFTYHLILQIKKKATTAVITFKPAVQSHEGEMYDFEDLGIEDFRQLEIYDEYGKLLKKGDNPQLTLSDTDEEYKISVTTCRISGRHEFQNIEPKIKISAETK